MAPGASGATTWKDVVQVPTTDLGKDGRAVQGIRIDFTTGQGHHGTVFVPRSEFTAEKAIQAIRDHAETLDRVGSSGG